MQLHQLKFLNEQNLIGTPILEEQLLTNTYILKFKSKTLEHNRELTELIKQNGETRKFSNLNVPIRICKKAGFKKMEIYL